MKKKITKAAKVWATNQGHGVPTLSWFLTPELLKSMKRERLLRNKCTEQKVFLTAYGPFCTGEKRTLINSLSELQNCPC